MDKIAEEAFKQTALSPTYGFIILAVNEQPGITQKELLNYDIQPHLQLLVLL